MSRGLSSLEIFDASFNQIKIFQNLDQMTSLNQLNLGFNLISSVADVVKNIGNIKSLTLRSNQLSSVKVSPSILPHLLPPLFFSFAW